MSLLNLKLRQENAVNINMCSIITKYPFNVLRSNCLVMVVIRICILIVCLIQNVAIAPQVQTSHPRKPCTSTQRQWLSLIPNSLMTKNSVSEGNREHGSENREGTHSRVYCPGSTDLEDHACLILRKTQKVPEKQQRQMCKVDLKWPQMVSGFSEGLFQEK